MDAVETESEKINLSVSSELITCWVSQTQSVMPRELECNRGDDQIPTKESREGLVAGNIPKLSVKKK